MSAASCYNPGVVPQTGKMSEVSHLHPTFPAKEKINHQVCEAEWAERQPLLPADRNTHLHQMFLPPAYLALPPASWWLLGSVAGHLCTPKSEQFNQKWACAPALSTSHTGTPELESHTEASCPLARDGKVRNNAVRPHTRCKMELWFNTSLLWDRSIATPPPSMAGF